MHSRNLVACPACTEHSFGCDACLHAHLLDAHQVRYSEVFGMVPDHWTSLCRTHRQCVGTMMGL